MIDKAYMDTLEAIKRLDLSGSGVTFWLVKRNLANYVARYSVMRVNTNEKLRERLKGYVSNQLHGKNFHLDEYDFNNADGDDVLFIIDAAATDFVRVREAIDAGFDNAIVKKYSDLLDSWAYVVQFECNGKQLYAWCQISNLSQAKKVKSRQATFFVEHRLVDVEEKEVFMIRPSFDFFVYGETIFIAGKKEFETSMNFREGMKAKADEALQDFKRSGRFENIDLIQRYVGDNLHHLRKMASILDAGYYRQPDYIQRMIDVSKEEGWGLKVENEKIVVEEGTVDLLLKLLNNDRLRSPINSEVFDAAAKAPVK